MKHSKRKLSSGAVYFFAILLFVVVGLMVVLASELDYIELPEISFEKKAKKCRIYW